MDKKTRVIAAIAVILGAAPAPAAAQVFKCVGADGKAAFQQTPCAETQVQTEVALENRQPKLKVKQGKGELLLYVHKFKGDARQIRMSLDLSRIVDDGYIRIRLNRKTLLDGQVLAAETTEELFDCVTGRSMLLAMNGAAVAEADQKWFDLPTASETRVKSEMLKANLCASR